MDGTLSSDSEDDDDDDEEEEDWEDMRYYVQSICDMFNICSLHFLDQYGVYEQV